MSVENVRVNAESRLIELAQQNPDGISNEDLKQNMPQVSLQDLTEIINKLLKSGTLELFTSRGELLYKYKDPSQKTAGKGSDIEAKLVYKIIEEAGNKGIWIRDIRFKSNLNMTQLNKILKNFETKSIIKAVKSVAASKKKVYMLFDLEPDSSVTGGAWYQDQDFESEFVDVLSQQCHRYLVHRLEDAVKQGGGPLLVHNRAYTKALEVQNFISELGISKVALSITDIESILYTVVLDNNAERTMAPDGTFLYKAINKFLPPTGLVKTSCGVCLLADKCASTGSVNPNTCVYIADWLNKS
ncbi:DNA-directed RNA polymerase III subunit RPC6 isoform X1 [Euwallacea fornicatus]|uniref:DNA-directed RNA polymerase III subunit RPC6 isoform X1 n=1 Tax=Euwallacea fornicatus TaxID=995702 RepID=UPI00338D602E